ncbi:MAG: YdcH family protein [Pseudomonadota bacterium]
MSHVPNELSEEFPEFKDKIHDLKSSNAHFLKLFDEYHEINRAVHRAETDIEPTDDLHLEDMRKKRLHLKDEIFTMLNA